MNAAPLPGRPPARAHVTLIAAATGLLVGCVQRDRPTMEIEPPGIFAEAESLRYEGRIVESVTRYGALIDSLRQEGDTARLWRARVGWAEAILRLGHHDSSETALDEAVRLAGADTSRIARTLLIRGVLLSRRGLFDSARTTIDRAREIALRRQDARMEADALYTLAEIHSLSGRYRDAIDASERQLELQRQLAAAPNVIASVLSQVGIDYRHVGRHADALEAYEQALDIYRAESNPEGQARVLYNMSNVRMAMGEPELALALRQEALELVEDISDPRGLGFVHGGLADVHFRAGNFSVARHHARVALEASVRTKLPYSETVSLIHLGAIEVAEARADSAFRHYLRATSIADSLGYGRQRSAARVGLSRVALLRRNSWLALRLADAAVAIADSVGDPEAQFEALEARARALELSGSVRAAPAYLHAIDFLESWRGRLALGDLRLGVAEPRLGVYEGAIRVLLASGRAGDAFAVAERGRARQLLELMAERGVATAASREQEVRQALREGYEALVSARSPALRASLEARLDSLAAELERLERAGDATRSIRPVSLSEVQRVLLDGDRAILKYFWGDSAVFGWWITRDAVRSARLGSSDSLSVLLEFLRGAVENPTFLEWAVPAERAYRTLVAPLEPGPVREIIAIPDGLIAHVPLEVLVPARGAAPLGVSTRLVYSPSSSVLLVMAREASNREWDRGLLAVGNPRSGRRFFASAATERGQPTLEPLPFADEEARALGSLFRDQGADVLTGRGASLERWLSLDPSRYRYLHFAVHANVDDQHADRTELLLADGSLDLPTIRRLTLTADLVTLSGCETGLGRRIRGEGVVGLPHAFLSAGSRGVIVSLWRVGDRSTAEFMRTLYTQLHAGTPPAEALRFVRESEYQGENAHPARWASFIIVGSVDPPAAPRR